jgi:hypothetical protein
MRKIGRALISLLLGFIPYTATAQVAFCPLAPFTRLYPAGVAVVAPGIRQLNLRALPALTTGIERQLAQGAALTLIGGPVCNNAFVWWRVELADGARGWAAEANWRLFFLAPVHASSTLTPLDWSCQARPPRICPLP